MMDMIAVRRKDRASFKVAAYYQQQRIEDRNADNQNGDHQRNGCMRFGAGHHREVRQKKAKKHTARIAHKHFRWMKIISQKR